MNPHEIEAAERILGLTLHGHHSHGHTPYPSHDPPRLANGGWMPPGTGPFRPGPGSPSFGALMPESHRPGVVFGPTHLGHYDLGRPVGWRSRGVDAFHNAHSSLPMPPSFGSRQRWHAVTHMGGHPSLVGGRTVMVGGQALTPAQITELKGLMVAALQSGAIKSASPVVPMTPAQAATLASWANRRAQGLLSPGLAQTSNAFRASHTLAAASQQKYGQLAEADAAALAATKKLANIFRGGSGQPGTGITSANTIPLQPPPGSGLDTNLDANFDANVPDPSASVSLKL